MFQLGLLRRRRCAARIQSRTIDVVNFAEGIVCRRGHVAGDDGFKMANSSFDYLAREQTR
jgi:hypothetical protein